MVGASDQRTGRITIPFLGEQGNSVAGGDGRSRADGATGDGSECGGRKIVAKSKCEVWDLGNTAIHLEQPWDAGLLLQDEVKAIETG